jgi:DNA-binding CsgD family transcriptional regulator
MIRPSDEEIRSDVDGTDNANGNANANAGSAEPEKPADKPKRRIGDTRGRGRAVVDNGGRPGRPRLKIDRYTVYRMARRGATNSEIAIVLDVSPDTLVKYCSELLRKARARRDMGLRAKQVEMAMRGNPTMAIWMGKQLLGQKDKTDITSDDRPIVQMLHGVSMEDLIPPEKREDHANGNGRKGKRDRYGRRRIREDGE